jgi:hypothetical protein
MILKSTKLNKIKGYLIDSKLELTIEAGYDDDREEDLNLDIYSNNRHININSTIEQSSISCGVYNMYSLPSNSQIDQILLKVKPLKRAIFLKELYSEIFVLLKKKEKMCTILASNNNSSRSSYIIKTFNSICTHKTTWKTNPNSGNKIRTWIF